MRIEAEAACRTAAAAAGKIMRSDFVETDPAFPRGCYYTFTNYSFFNLHAVGAGWSTFQLLCAVATTGAPLKRRRRTDAQTGARVPTPRVCCAALAGGVRNTRPALRCAHIYK